MSDRKDFSNLINHLESKPGIYKMLANGFPLYIGKAKDLRKRLKQYFMKTAPSHRIAVMLSQVDDIQVIITENESEALILENRLIKEYQPKYNILLKDDKSFPYLMFSDHDYPSLFVKKSKKAIPNHAFGPYPHRAHAKTALDQVQRVFHIRNCSDHFFRNRTRPCIQFEIKRCSAPCVGYISPKEYQEDVLAAKKLLSGQGGEFHQKMIQKMYAYADNQEFERAAACRDLLKSVSGKKMGARSPMAHANVFYIEVMGACAYVVNMEIIQEKVTHIEYDVVDLDGKHHDEWLEQYLYHHYSIFSPPPVLIIPLKDTQPLATALGIKIHSLFDQKFNRWVHLAKQNLLAHQQGQNEAKFQWHWFWAQIESFLSNKVSKIICIDISHHQGSSTYASCVVCSPSGMDKKLYRTYKLNTGGDDYQAIELAMLKKIKSGTLDPDTVVLIDGGKGQLRSAQNACDVSKFSCYLTSIAKGSARIWGKETFYKMDNGIPLRFRWPEELIQYILHIRDHAHDLAISRHRSALRKQSTQSILNQVDGIGDSKKKKLLAYFGGLEQIKSAKLSELEQVPGVGPVLAQKIFQALHIE